eukprot:4687058-Pyramimonas_sp.AAC.1
MVATATQIATVRHGKTEGKLAQGYLTFLDEERALTLALLADAGDECNVLVRCMDTEAMDPSSVALNIHSFLNRVWTLFEEEQCWGVGYTAYMVNQLETPLLLLTMDGGHRTLGGPNK